MPARKPRVRIPRTPEGLLTLTERLCARHEADAAASPLAGLDMARLKANGTQARAEHGRASELRKKAEQCTELRDRALGIASARTEEGTALFTVLAARDVLLGLHKGREHRLGDWGFEVDASPRAKVKPAAKP
jgi:hypothetical protein